MARPHGRAKVDPNSPKAFAVCQRCGFWYNHVDLTWAVDYRGKDLQNLRLLVCDICLDVPQPQNKPVIITADPIPVMNARPEFFAIDETSYRVDMSGNQRVTMGGGTLVVTGSDTYPETDASFLT